MPVPTDLDSFLANNRIEKTAWERAAIDWPILLEIGQDHESQLDRLRDSADFFAGVIQRFPGVHSVRSRIKDAEHLLEKIIRKRSDGVDKYQDITPGNYHELVTDLVGLRALHLFKEDCLMIDKHLKGAWNLCETPKAYVREGDPDYFTALFREQGFEVEMHSKGYRSVHYIFSTQPLQRKVFTEVQVRTIFEEGWSEIDHRVRYPNFSNDRLVSYFLTIFNRLAGSADEMGTFVKDLTRALEGFENQLTDANEQREQALSEMDKVLGELQEMKAQDSSMKQKLSAMQTELSKLRQLSAPSPFFNEASRARLGGLASLSLTNQSTNESWPPSYVDSLKVSLPTSETLKFGESLKAVESFGLARKVNPK